MNISGWIYYAYYTWNLTWTILLKSHFSLSFPGWNRQLKSSTIKERKMRFNQYKGNAEEELDCSSSCQESFQVFRRDLSGRARRRPLLCTWTLLKPHKRYAKYPPVHDLQSREEATIKRIQENPSDSFWCPSPCSTPHVFLARGSWRIGSANNHSSRGRHNCRLKTT